MCKITNEILREAGYKKSYFPSPTFKLTAVDGKFSYCIEFHPTADKEAYSMSIRQYVSGGLQSSCVLNRITDIDRFNSIITALFPITEPLKLTLQHE